MGWISCFWKNVGRTSFAKAGYRFLRKTMLFLHLIKHSGRQEFLLGKLKKQITFQNLQKHVEQNGFEKNYFGWVDDGEVLSMRKVVNDEYQYHIRLFSDNEIRCHYEFAPDRRPLKHYFEKQFVPEKEYFNKLLKGFLE